jgi:hypothetical protein
MSQPGQSIDWEDLAWDHDFKGNDRAMLEHYYNIENLTMVEIGRKIEVNATTISRRMKELGIEVVRKVNANCGRGPRLQGKK